MIGVSPSSKADVTGIARSPRFVSDLRSIAESSDFSSCQQRLNLTAAGGGHFQAFDADTMQYWKE